MSSKKQPIAALIREKVGRLHSGFRQGYLKLLGLGIGTNVVLGKIHCLWPANVKIGNKCTIQDYVDFRIAHPFSGNNSIEIGDRVFIGRCCEFNASSKITIGDDCMIASNTTLVDVGHDFSEHIPINQQAIIAKDITICEDVWIGTGCRILRGVTIGKGSIVGAGSVVNKSIPENQIWAGVPAKFIKNRFNN